MKKSLINCAVSAAGESWLSFVSSSGDDGGDDHDDDDDDDDDDE